MSEEGAPRPLAPLRVVAGAPEAPPARHETRLLEEPAEERAALRRALDEPTVALRMDALRAVAAANPAHLEAWARLGEALDAQGDTLGAYAAARVAYHRGLDRLRRQGWGGTGLVRWSHEPNRGFLRGLRLLLTTSAALGDLEEASRSRAFLLDLDPDDALGAATFPEWPGPDWAPPPPPP